MKRCIGCGELKQPSEFREDKRTRHGVSSYCLKCKPVYLDLDKKSQGHKRWYAENRDVIYTSIRDKVIAAVRAHQKANPNKVRTWHSNRRARIRGNGGTITEKEWKDLCDKYDNKCLCCERNDMPLTLDHVIPIDSGGPNVIANAQPLCGSCNSRKGTKTTDYRP